MAIILGSNSVVLATHSHSGGSQDFNRRLTRMEWRNHQCLNNLPSVAVIQDFKRLAVGSNQRTVQSILAAECSRVVITRGQIAAEIISVVTLNTINRA